VEVLPAEVEVTLSTVRESSPPRWPATLLLPTGLMAALLLIICMALAFAWGTVSTLQQLTNPYVQSSALVRGFFARLSGHSAESRRAKYVQEHLAVGGLQFTKKSGWLMFGKPAKVTGTISNDGDRIVDTLTVGIYFANGAGRIEAGGDIVIPLLIRPGEQQNFSLTEKETGFPLPAHLEGLRLIHRVVDCHFYEPPAR